MVSLLSIIASLAATAQGILTFIALVNLKGIGFTLGTIFALPVFILFPIWSYFVWDLSYPIIFACFVIFLLAQIASSKIENFGIVNIQQSFYENKYKDWFFYYLITINWGIILNLLTPLMNDPLGLNVSPTIFDYLAIFFSFVFLVYIPIKSRNKKLSSNSDYRSSKAMTIFGIIIIVLSVSVNILSTSALLIVLS